MSYTYNPHYQPSKDEIDAIFMEVGFYPPGYRERLEATRPKWVPKPWNVVIRAVILSSSEASTESAKARLAQEWPEANLDFSVLPLWHLELPPDEEVERRFAVCHAHVLVLPSDLPLNEEWLLWAKQQGFTVIEY